MRQESLVLLIDDDQDMRWAMRNILADAGFDVAEAGTGESGLEAAARKPPNAVLLDMRMPGVGGEEVLRRLRRLDPGLPVIIVTAHGTISGAVSAVRDGAFDYVTKPFRNQQILDALLRAIARRPNAQGAPADGIRGALFAAMGQGPSIQALAARAEAVVATDYSVVICGETGSGKEVVARNLHKYGPRTSRPLIVIDCGAVAETLTDSEFFGHEKGAYTGASERHRGWFESAANGGSVFLDEIGNLAATGQKALLRTLEDRTIRRVGGAELINLDVRFIAATNDDLKERARTGSFRKDLFFRLSEYVIVVPPLRARPEDISFLARRFLTQAREGLRRLPIGIDPSALDLMCSYRWPGNVRELRNVMRRAALTSAGAVMPDDLADLLDDSGTSIMPEQNAEADIGSFRRRVRGQVRAIECDAVIAALKQAGGNKAKAARLLGIDYKTYRTKLKRLDAPPRGTADDQA